jgi:tetratricopeptide (TPR) repeat protein
MKKTLDLMKQIGKVGIAAAFLLVFVNANAQTPEIDNAEHLFDEDKKKKAIELLQTAATSATEPAVLYYHLGHAQLLTGDKAGAKASFDNGVKANPKEGLNYAGLAYLLVLDKKTAEAKALFDKALSLGKKNVANLRAIAEGEMHDKSLSKDALSLLQKAKEINNTDAKTFLLLGDYYLNENMGGPSASAYEDAATLDSKNSARPYYNIALLYMRSRNVPLVEEHLLKALSVDPNFALAHKELGELYYLKKDGTKAAKYYKGYLDLTDSPEDNYQFVYAHYLFMAKDFAKANELFKALSVKPDVTPTTLRFYVRSLEEAGNHSEAQKIFEQYLTSKKDSVKAGDYQIYAQILKNQGKDSLWSNALQKSLELDKNQPTTLESLFDYNFGKKKVWSYAKAAEFGRALIKLRKVSNPKDFYNLGRALYLSKNYPSADTAFAKLIELQPKIVLPYTWAARSKAVQDEELKDALAKPFYEKVIELGELEKDKNKNELISAYQYMGSYHLIKSENQIAKGYFEKALAMNPDNEEVKKSIMEAIKHINTPVPQQKPKRTN